MASCRSPKSCILVKEMQDQIDDKEKRVRDILKGYRSDKKFWKKIFLYESLAVGALMIIIIMILSVGADKMVEIIVDKLPF